MHALSAQASLNNNNNNKCFHCIANNNYLSGKYANMCVIVVRDNQTAVMFVVLFPGLGSVFHCFQLSHVRDIVSVFPSIIMVAFSTCSEFSIRGLHFLF